MRFIIALLFLAVLLGFPAIAAAQSCFGPSDQVLSFTHPKDSSPYYFVFDSGWGNKVPDGTKSTYSKGTSRLIFETGSATAAPKIVFSKYNNPDNYEKIVDWAEVTVNGLPGFIIEFEDKQEQTTTFGETVVIYGAEVDGAKKYFAVTMTAKELNYEEEKALFDDYYKTFNLELPNECITDDGGTGDTGNGSDSGDTNDTGQNDTNTGDTPNDTGGTGGNDSDGSGGDSSGSPGSNTGAKEPMKIFGFDPIIVAAAVLLFLLIIFFVVIVIAVIGVVAYFMFFRKK